VTCVTTHVNTSVDIRERGHSLSTGSRLAKGSELVGCQAPDEPYEREELT
jgi:hypothetical protein